MSHETRIEEKTASHAEVLDKIGAGLAEAREAAAKVTSDPEAQRATTTVSGSMKLLAVEIEQLRAQIAAARADAEKADHLRTLAESQLETEREKSAAIQSRFDFYKTQISSLEEADGHPIVGDGIDVVVADRRNAVPNVEFPADANASRRWFGRQKFEWEDGTTVMTTRTSAKLTHGKLSPAAIQTMIAHARREGWSPILVSARSPAVRRAIADAARSAGLLLEGEEAAVSIAQGQRGQRRPPLWSTKVPASWTRTDREAAQMALDKLKKDGKVPAALPLDDYGRRVHEDYQKRQVESGIEPCTQPGEHRRGTQRGTHDARTHRA